MQISILNFLAHYFTIIEICLADQFQHTYIDLKDPKKNCQIQFFASLPLALVVLVSTPLGSCVLNAQNHVSMLAKSVEYVFVRSFKICISEFPNILCINLFADRSLLLVKQ